MIIHILKYVFSASDIKEAVSLFLFLWYDCNLTTIHVEPKLLTKYEVLKLKTCSFYLAWNLILLKDNRHDYSYS